MAVITDGMGRSPNPNWVPGVPGGGQAMLDGDGPPVDGVTGLNSSIKVYQNNTPDFDAGEAVLYVNIDEADPSTNPVWRGVMNQ